MYFSLARRMLGMDKRALWKLAWNMGIKGALSVERFRWRLKRGEFFPPFLYISIINSCNLRCQGCWVDVAAEQQTIDAAAMHRMLNEAKSVGNVFFGILGGEPFMHPELLDILEKHPDCYFQVFTNGQFITPAVAQRLRKLGNVTPLISVEGNEIVSDERRGRKGVFSKTLRGLQNCLDEKIFVGVCTSLCQTNIDHLLTDAWVDRLIEMGVMYLWYHTYRPVGPEAHGEMALTPEQQLRVRKFVVETRVRKPIIVIDAYYDGDGKAICPAASGLTHHISPWGDIEPCPIIQFATDSIHKDTPLREQFQTSAFLRDFRETAAGATRGCIVLERPDLLEEVVARHSAHDTTARKTALRELQAMQIRPSQDLPEQVPERSWAYRLAKWLWYHDFGTYARVRAAQPAPPPAPRERLAAPAQLVEIG